jgi:3-isopropylmalate/(R)-2-methylmalate dehydratase small subunit
MDKITRVEGVAAPLLVDNISTDILSPGSVMTSPKADFARGLMAPWRDCEDGSDNPDFVLNQPRFRQARVLLAGRNFGCGSSREAAVWCLQRYGIGCVIAPSFADIFFDNAFKNGVLAIRLDEQDIAALAAELERDDVPATLAVDLETMTIRGANRSIPFTMDPERRVALMEGLDEIDLILRDDAAISAFQDRLKAEEPWLEEASLAIRSTLPAPGAP